MSFRTIMALFAGTVFIILGFVNGCRDTGSAPLPQPEITKVEPDSGAVGDTIKIEGKNFGDTRGGSVVRFGSVSASDHGEWRNDEIKVRVPNGVQPGSLQVTVRTEGGVSNGKNFKVLGQAGGVDTVRFSTQIQPIFNQSCLSGCHVTGGSAPFSLQAGVSYDNLVNVTATTGSCAGILRRVKPSFADSSALYRRVSGTTCGVQMPLSGSLLLAAEINLIRNWINQGAQP